MRERFGTLRGRRGDRWYLDLRPFGALYSLGGVPFVGDRGRIVAEAVLESLRVAMAKGERPQDVMARMNGPAHRELVLDAYARWLKHFADLVAMGKRSSTTLREYRRIGASDMHYWEGRGLESIRYAALEEWNLSMEFCGIGDKSRRNRLGALRACCVWLLKREEIEALPPFPTVSVREHVPTIIPVDDLDRVLSEIAEARRGIFLCMARMGLRPGEARALTVADVERRDRQWWMHVRHALQGPSSHARIGPTKNRRDRRVPVHPELQQWMRDHIDWRGQLRRAPLFSPGDGEGRFNHWMLDAIWKRASRSCGIEVSLYEGTKHAFASHALAAGVELRVIQEFLGHADARSTERYARIMDDALLDVFKRDPKHR